jgi:hypothetical protein
VRGKWEELGVRIREVDLLHLLRFTEKNEQSDEFECTPIWRTFQYRDSGNTDTKTSNAEI